VFCGGEALEIIAYILYIMKLCDYCSKELDKTLVTEIGCKHTFCIKCTSLVSYHMEVCPKCQSIVKNEKIYFYKEYTEIERSQKQMDQLKSYQIDQLLWNQKLLG